MPVRLILLILCAVFVAVFAGFNLDNRSNVWLFHTFENVPVFITAIVSFLAALLIALPFAFKRQKKITEADVKKFEENKVKAEEKAKKDAERKALAEKKALEKAEKLAAKKAEEEKQAETEKAEEEKIADEKEAENLADAAQ